MGNRVGNRADLPAARQAAEVPARSGSVDAVALADLVNRVLDRGAVVSGEVVIGVAGVDLLYLGLNVVLASVESLRERGAWGSGPPVEG